MIGRIVIAGRLYGVLRVVRTNPNVAPARVLLQPRNAPPGGPHRETWLLAGTARVIDDVTRPFIPEIEPVMVMEASVADEIGYVPSLAAREVFALEAQDLRTSIDTDEKEV